MIFLYVILIVLQTNHKGTTAEGLEDCFRVRNKQMKETSYKPDFLGYFYVLFL